MKSVTLKIIGVTLACFFVSYVAAKFAGVVKYPDDLGRKYMVKLREGHEFTFDQEIQIEGVDEIEVETVSSDIHIAQKPTREAQGKMHAKFTGPDSLGFTTLRAGNKLYLKVAKKAESQNSWHVTFDDGANELALELPAQVKGIAIKTVSGDVEADDLKLATFGVETTSGELTLKRADFSGMKVRSVSGDFLCKFCKIQKYEGKSVSGDVSLMLRNLDPEVDAKSTSGDIEVRFDKKPDVQLQLATVSGEIAMEPAFGKADSERRSVEVRLGNGKGKIEGKTVSGDLKVGFN